MSDSEKVDTVKNIKKEKRKMNISEAERERRKKQFLENTKPKLDKYREEKNHKKDYLGALRNLNVFSSSEDEKEEKKKPNSPVNKEKIIKEPDIKTEKLKKMKNMMKTQDDKINHILKRTEKIYQMKKQKEKLKNNNNKDDNKINNDDENKKIEKENKINSINDFFKIKPLKINLN